MLVREVGFVALGADHAHVACQFGGLQVLALADGAAVVRDLRGGRQETVRLDGVAAAVIGLLEKSD